MDKTLGVNRHLAAENQHRMVETLAELPPDCVFEDLSLGKTYRGRAQAEDYYRFWWDAFDLEIKASAATGRRTALLVVRRGEPGPAFASDTCQFGDMLARRKDGVQ